MSRAKASLAPSVRPLSFKDWAGVPVPASDILAADKALAPFALSTCQGSCSRREIIAAVRALGGDSETLRDRASRLLKMYRATWRARGETPVKRPAARKVTRLPVPVNPEIRWRAMFPSAYAMLEGRAA